MSLIKKDWSIVYEKAIRDDGSYFFPERLNEQFLSDTKRTQGTVMFANQYLNEVFPEENAAFKVDWFRYCEFLPTDRPLYHFAFIDPAISMEDGADYTGIVIVAVDHEKKWYLRYARRERLTPPQIINKIFEIHRTYQTLGIGVESVAYQKALLYMAAEEMQRRGEFPPVKEIKPGTDKSKEMRIMGLIPRFEWGQIYLTQGMEDLKKELLQFPRSAHDDISDALSQVESVIFYPIKQEVLSEPAPNQAGYESWHIQQLIKRANEDAG